MPFVRCTIAALALALCAGSIALAAEDRSPTTVASAAFDKLKQHIPQTVAGMKRGDVNSQKVTIDDSEMTVVDASYINPDDTSEQPPSADITFCDYGPNSPIAEAAASWSKTDFNRVSDGEYEKTVKIQGFPALESYNTQDSYGTMTIFVGGRILVTLNVTNLTVDQMRAEANALPLKKLAEVK